MRIDILTIFPGMFQGPFDESIIKRARVAGIVDIRVHNVRDFATDRHRTTDDYPFGGGVGMIMKPEPIFATVESIIRDTSEVTTDSRAIVLLSASGRQFDQQIAEQLSTLDHLILICGRYEGVDHRVASHMATDELSIGSYVLTGGELPAMVIADAVIRLLPGSLSCAASALDESYTSGLLEYPQYTRPADFRGLTVPEVLLSGNHQRIARWRRERALEKTFRLRPELLARQLLSAEDILFLTELQHSDTADDCHHDT